MVICAAVAIAAAVSLQLSCKQHNAPVLYGVPLFPYVPALSVAVNTFLLGQLQKPAYERFGIWTAIITCEWLLSCQLQMVEAFLEGCVRPRVESSRVLHAIIIRGSHNTYLHLHLQSGGEQPSARLHCLPSCATC
eukprot:GHRQ01028303.1.p1 GENE.GHRQ01028303.1~~GHRQ01028303.1.p1  ORF type:complete len:135 (-),score=23.88 GHRQ01028303.1:177-581(-)